jgi:hypothetical protein
MKAPIRFFRPFCASTMQVCPVEVEWVDIVMPRLRGVDVKRLSGGATTEAAIADASAAAAGEYVLWISVFSQLVQQDLVVG